MYQLIAFDTLSLPLEQTILDFSDQLVSALTSLPRLRKIVYNVDIEVFPSYEIPTDYPTRLFDKISSLQAVWFTHIRLYLRNPQERRLEFLDREDPKEEWEFWPTNRN